MRWVPFDKLRVLITRTIQQVFPELVEGILSKGTIRGIKTKHSNE